MVTRPLRNSAEARPAVQHKQRVTLAVPDAREYPARYCDFERLTAHIGRASFTRADHDHENFVSRAVQMFS
jgi:hypothetical protein